MSKRGKLPQELWDVYRAMSVDVGRIGEFGFMRESACMGEEERRLLAFSLSAKEIFDDVDFSTFIDGFAVPFLTKLGRAKWKRDVVTDLGFALAYKKDTRKKLGEALLDFVPVPE